MSEIIEIPDLDDENLVELTACGHLRTRTAKTKQKLIALQGGIIARIGGKRSHAYIYLAGNPKGHLHIDVMIRSSEWAAKQKLRPLRDAQNAIMQFAGIPIDVTVSGELIVDISSLPDGGIIRSAMRKAEHGGLSARQTAQTLSINDNAIKELTWRELDWPDIPEKVVVVKLVLEKSARVDSEYLRDCEEYVLRAFKALILGGKVNAANRR